MTWRVAVGTLLVAITTVIIAFWAVNEPVRMQTYAQGFEGRSIEAGAAIFKNNCVTCHGVDGGGASGPVLNHAELFNGTRTTQAEWPGTIENFIYQTVSAGRPVRSVGPDGANLYGVIMPTWSQEYGGPLRPDQVRDVVAYVMNFEKNWLDENGKPLPTATPSIMAVGTDITDPELPAGDAARGEKLVTKQGCVGCHVNGNVGPAWMAGSHPSGTGIGTHAQTTFQDAAYTGAATSAEQYLRESIVQPNAHVVSGFAANIMPGNYGAKLEAQDVADIIAYLLSLK